MIDPKIVWQFYSSDRFKPTAPPRTSWRHFRFKLKDGGWRKVPIKISDIADLQKWIFKYGGCDLYYGTSCWLNPHKVSMKNASGSYLAADNLLLSNDLVFDVDAPDPICEKNVDKARQSAYNIYKYMQGIPEYELDYVAFTGYKGFRLVYHSKLTELPEDYRLRLDHIVQKRKAFIQTMRTNIKEKPHTLHFRRAGVFFDEDITINPMCVIRLLGSVHTITGFISTQIAPTDLLLPLPRLLDKTPYITQQRPGIPGREMTRKAGNKASPHPRLESSERDVTGNASPPSKYYISNRVLGIKKGFVPVFIYQKNQAYYEKELFELQGRFRLGNLYVYDLKDHIMAISLKCMQRRQLQKVLSASSSKTKYTFLKFRRIYMPFAIIPTKVMKSPFYTSYFSRGHAMLVRAKLKEGSLCGWPKVEIIQAQVAPNG